MKKSNRFTLTRFFTPLVILAALALSGPVAASASTSGGATIHNWVSVSYASGTFSATTTSFVDVTVVTLAAQVNITTPQGKTVVPGTFVTYSSAIYSNANGLDTYNLGSTSPTTSTTGITGSPTTTFNFGADNVTSISLWGGITVVAASSGSAVLSFPGGSLHGSGLVSGSILWINNTTYTVKSVFEGQRNTSVNNASNEAYDTITLVTNLGASVDAGTQIGEWKKFAIEFTAGTPTTAGTDGEYKTVVTATSGATDLVGNTPAISTLGTKTTVQSPNLTITKQCAVTPTWLIGALDTTKYGTNCSAKPGQTIEYLITLTNANSNPTSVASSVKVQDPVTYAYTKYVTGSTYAGNGTVTLSQLSDDTSSGASPLVAGYTFSTSIAGGSTTANVTNQAFIVYRVAVN